MALRRGIALTLLVLAATFVVVVAAIASVFFMLSREPAVPEQTTLVLRLEGELTEVASEDVVGHVLRTARPTLRSQVEAIRKAKVDRRIAALLVRPSAIDVGLWGKLQELHEAIVDFRRSGKQAIAFLEFAGERGVPTWPRRAIAYS